MNGGCTNCGDPRVDVYCAHCGEKQPNLEDLSIRHLAHEAIEELAHVDSKLVRTLVDVSVKPGLLPVEYFAGRKKRYVAPLRLFLILFALQFVAYTVFKPTAMYSIETFMRWERTGTFSKRLDAKAKQKGISREQLIERIDNRWQKNLSLLQLANVVGLALVMKVLYARRRRYMAEHLVFIAYYLAFSYLFSLLVWPVYYVMGLDPGPFQTVMSAVYTILNFIYLYVGMRRFYGQGPGKTVAKMLLLSGGVYVVSMAILIGALVAALLQHR